MKNKNKTNSLSLATYLTSTGLECLINAQDPSSPQLTFVFNTTEEKFEELLKLFWSKKALVDPLSYFEALRVMKSRIYQYKNQERNHESKRFS